MTIDPHKPGKFRQRIETKRAAQGIRAQIPVLTVTGRRPGPTAAIMAAQHGRELNGIAVIEKVFEQLDPENLSGTVLFFPVMNPVGVRMHQHDYPTEEYRYRPTGIKSLLNMNRAWSKEAMQADTFAATVAETVHREYFSRIDFGVDFHAWSGLSLSLAWAPQEHRDFLRAFGLPWHMVVDKIHPDGKTDAAAAERDIPWITCELTPHNTVNPVNVAHGVRGVLNLLAFKGMLNAPLSLPETQYEFLENHEETVIRTPCEGLIVSDRRIGEWIKQGETVLRILSLETLETVFEYTAVREGLLFNLGGTHWGEDRHESFVVFPGQMVGLLKKPDLIMDNP
jgi:predicted deacylase